MKRYLAHQPNVWARNSLVLGYLKPGVSDLDLTLYFKTPLSVGERLDLVEFLAAQKRVILFLGETNIYFEQERDIVSRVINQIELERDPSLSAQLSVMRRPATRAEAFVFLLRMLEADYQNLKARPHLRLRKWKWNFHAVSHLLNSRYEFDLHRPLVDQIFEILSLIGRFSQFDRIQAAILSYLDLKQKGTSLHEIAGHITHHVEWFFLWPNRFCFLNPQGQTFSEECLEIFSEQLRWEIFGAITQHKLVKSSGEFCDHLDRLAVLAHEMKLDMKSTSILADIQKTKEMIQAHHV